ncbi:type 1 glutamine amidotransferase (plasmid) [Natrinema zhouii]|uniref:type 1 glutamine amidotransferase domain-containing protein n=1 Tax=Natrinema TaxID=88723 RepID=UPI001CF07822|nr:MULTISPECIES: type 1 glutamine amidotransferase domain-containing protein [Natrinema]UHQ98719.1 type 1 glutamine amidotransferase [Natrinema zhouii]
MSTTDRQPLDGVSVGILVAQEGTEEVEFTEPKETVSDAGADVVVLSSDTGDAQTVNNDLDEADAYSVDKRFSEVSADEYDALIVPGGTVGADNLRADEDGVDLIKQHRAENKPIGSICHGPWTLVEAGVVDNRELTSYASLRTDVENAGGEWTDQEVVVDDGVVTSRNPDDLDAFTDAIVEEFAAASE